MVARAAAVESLARPELAVVHGPGGSRVPAVPGVVAAFAVRSAWLGVATAGCQRRQTAAQLVAQPADVEISDKQNHYK